MRAPRQRDHARRGDPATAARRQDHGALAEGRSQRRLVAAARQRRERDPAPGGETNLQFAPALEQFGEDGSGEDSGGTAAPRPDR